MMNRFFNGLVIRFFIVCCVNSPVWAHMGNFGQVKMIAPVGDRVFIGLQKEFNKEKNDLVHHYFDIY